MRCACFWNVDGDCIHKDTQNGSCGVEENVRQKAIEASNSAEVKPESKSAAAEAGMQQTNNAIALLMEIVECAKNDKSVDTWLLSNYKRVNAVVAQQH